MKIPIGYFNVYHVSLLWYLFMRLFLFFFCCQCCRAAAVILRIFFRFILPSVNCLYYVCLIFVEYLRFYRYRFGRGWKQCPVHIGKIEEEKTKTQKCVYGINSHFTIARTFVSINWACFERVFAFKIVHYFMKLLHCSKTMTNNINFCFFFFVQFNLIAQFVCSDPFLFLWSCYISFVVCMFLL